MEKVVATTTKKKKTLSHFDDLPRKVRRTLFYFDTAACSRQHILQVKQHELKGFLQMWQLAKVSAPSL